MQYVKAGLTKRKTMRASLRTDTRRYDTEMPEENNGKTVEHSTGCTFRKGKVSTQKLQGGYETYISFKFSL